MQPSTISFEEKERITGASANLFKVRHPEYFASPANSDKLVSFIENQLGMSILDFPYPLQLENFEAAYFAILKSGGWFYERPVEEEIEDPAVMKERQAQERVRAEYDAQQAAAKMQRDRNMPLSELGQVVGVQNADFRQQRELNKLPVRSTGMESRHVEQVKLGIPAQARVNVGLANRGLDIHSAEFTKLYSLELQRLRAQQ